MTKTIPNELRGGGAFDFEVQACVPRRGLSLLVGLTLWLLFPSAWAALDAEGFLNITYVAGTNLIANPFDTGTNALSALFANPPDGATISLWDAATQRFNQRSEFTTNGGWSPDLALPPGQGALLDTPKAFVNTYAGTTLEPDGSPWPVDDSGPLKYPATNLSTGTFLLSCKAPIDLASPQYPVFPLVVGRAPLEGEQFTSFDAKTQSYRTNTFHAGAWAQGEPALPVGTSAFFHLVGGGSGGGATNGTSPSLQAILAGHALVVSWPTSATNFLLQVSTNLSATPVWGTITNGIATNATSLVFTNANLKSRAFYRLRK